MSIEIKHNKQNEGGSFFSSENEKTVAEMTYVFKNGNMVIEHTSVDESLRGKNVGSQLLAKAVNFAREKNMKIVPVCSYAKKVMERSDEYKDVLAT